jgi:transcriptional regulator GlxA family with amidase domain
MSRIETALFLAFPDVGEQDLLAAWELFRSHAWSINERGGGSLQVTLGSFTPGPITTHMGATLELERQISPSERFDLIYIPGGVGAADAAGDETVLRFVRDHHADGRWVAGNCAGMGVLHRAGILDGVEVTAPATLARRLQTEGTTVTTPRRAWKIVPERRIFSAAGAATVHPSTIALVWHLFGDQAGRELAANWDSLPLHGENLFSLAGPQMSDDAETTSAVQANWEDVLLPAA